MRGSAASVAAPSAPRHSARTDLTPGPPILGEPGNLTPQPPFPVKERGSRLRLVATQAMGARRELVAATGTLAPPIRGGSTRALRRCSNGRGSSEGERQGG